MKERAIRQTVTATVRAMQLLSAPGSYLHRSSWPAPYDVRAAVIIGGVLAARGLGEWWIVDGHRPGETRGHTWLEYREACRVLYSVDADLTDVPEAEATHFVGPGLSPSAGWFTERQSAYPRSEWLWLEADNDWYNRELKQVLSFLEQERIAT